MFMCFKKILSFFIALGLFITNQSVFPNELSIPHNRIGAGLSILKFLPKNHPLNLDNLLETAKKKAFRWRQVFKFISDETLARDVLLDAIYDVTKARDVSHLVSFDHLPSNVFPLPIFDFLSGFFERETGTINGLLRVGKREYEAIRRYEPATMLKFHMDPGLHEYFERPLERTRQSDLCVNFIKYFFGLEWHARYAVAFVLELAKQGLAFERIVTILKCVGEVSLETKTFLPFLLEETDIFEQEPFKIKEISRVYWILLSQLSQAGWHEIEIVSLFKIYPSRINWFELAELIQEFSLKERRNHDLFVQKMIESGFLPSVK
jgi:hypothetical protein